MCGIAGLIQYDGTSIDKKPVIHMCEALKHRGPDGEGFFLDHQVCFGHRRLAIIDIAG